MGELSAPGRLSAPRVELLCWSECPSHEQAQKVLGEALADLGYNSAAVTCVWVEDDDAASDKQFVGSPTFRVDGTDLFPAPADEQYGLTCRLYRRRDGRPSPLPDPDDLREALRAALAPSSD
jgi:hypothetical protein